jgi:ubiquinone/menaquinone biosynthesis C-methylase UbiE
MTQGASKPYVIDDDDEPQRLERQAQLADLPSHLARFPLAPDARVLDAGCGSGAMARLLAQRAPLGHATGVDTNSRYLAIAAQQAAAQGISNITFQEGNIFQLPFADHTFDLVWCKYVLQWVEQPVHAVAEFRRVTRPGGLVVCCHFDGFGVTHDPIDPELQADVEVFFPQVIDPFVGRKQYGMLHHAGLRDITVYAEADRSFAVYGAIDTAHRANWQAQLDAAFPAIIRCLGSEARAKAFVERFLTYQARDDTASYCTLYIVTGRVPAASHLK